MKSHANIPVFIPHLGCPNQCVFCNQRSISGVERFEPADVEKTIESALATIKEGTDVEIAFFGGSFTGIDRKLMISLLETAKKYIDSGRVNSVRCSTRPDYIDEEIVAILKDYAVKTVELGLQSTNEAVLSASKRGHGFQEERQACKLITDAGLSLVGQMMVGLPESTLESEMETADFIISAGATAARIYPTVVFTETELCEMAKKAFYTPLSTEDAVNRSAVLLDKFYSAGVEIIRIGLCASENLASDRAYYAGPNHPALGELVENEFYYRRFRERISALSEDISDTVKISVPKGSLSKAIGQNQGNKKRLSAEFPAYKIKFAESSELSGYDFCIQTERNKRCI